jgi:hypothetical protein
MKRMPIKAAEEVSKKYNLSQVIIVAWDEKDGVTHFVSYGRNKKHCDMAAAGSKKLQKFLFPGENEIEEISASSI